MDEERIVGLHHNLFYRLSLYGNGDATVLRRNMAIRIPGITGHRIMNCRKETTAGNPSFIPRQKWIFFYGAPVFVMRVGIRDWSKGVIPLRIQLFINL